MTHKTLRRVLVFCSVLLFVFSSSCSMVAAATLPQDDLHALHNDSVWHKIYKECVSTSSGSSSGSTSGSLPPGDKLSGFVDTYGQMAYDVSIKTAVPWEDILAQAIWESGYGASAPGYNFFGIKADSSWTGATQELQTTEFINGQYISVTATFRAYSSAQDSFNDHANFLRSNSGYWPAFQFSNDPLQFLTKVWEAGYATAPDYVQNVGGIMQQIIDYNNQTHKLTPSSQIKFNVPLPGPGDTTQSSPTGSSGGGSCAQNQNQAGSLTLNYEDTTRPTRGVGATRKLNTTVWYPGDSNPHPLVILAIGYNQSPNAYARYAQAIAAKGFIVAAPSFPLADPAASGGVLNRDLEERTINQVNDIKFLLGKLAVESQLGSRLDPGKVAVVGHSDGADTALAAGYSSIRIAELSSVVAIAPDNIGGLSSGPPLLLMHGDADATVPYSESVAVFPTISASPKYFVTLLGADHFEPVVGNTPQTPAIDALTTTFLANPSGDIANLISSQYSQFARLET